MTVDQLLKPDPPRDRYGRYLLRLPGDQKPRGRTRVTTFIRALDQGDGLIAWKATATMVGALRNPGLHAKWAAIFAQSQDPWYHSDDLKTKCKKLVDECADHGGAQSRAALGTALHAMLELVARGETPNLVDPYKADVEAWMKTLYDHALHPVPEWTEVCVYIEQYDLVGTFDGLFDQYYIGPNGEHDPGSPYILGDNKTETSTDYKALAHAAQLAAYSLATHRIIFPDDPDDTATLQPLPDFDHDTGLIIHLPAGQATCTLHAVDLNQGREALELASKMRRMDAQRKRKDTGGLMRPWTPAWPDKTSGSVDMSTQLHDEKEASCPPVQPVETPVPSQSDSVSTTGSFSPVPTTTPTEADLKSRLREIHQHQPDLAHLIGRRWPPGVPAIKDSWAAAHCAAVRWLLDQVDIEGPMLDIADVDRLTLGFLTLDDPQSNRVKQWVTQAASDPNRYRPLALGAGNHTTRRIYLAEVCLLVAGNDMPDGGFRSLIWEALNERHNVINLDTGQALGLMNWREAQHLLTLTRLHLNLNTTIETDNT